jgi:hypothetical protein
VTLLAAAIAASAALIGSPGSGHAAGFATIEADQVELRLRFLADPELEGRDTPSVGLERAARYIEQRFQEAGLVSAPDTPDWRRHFPLRRLAPVAEECLLEIDGHRAPSAAPATGEARAGPPVGAAFALGRDFVPYPGCYGRAEGPLVFAGYGIKAPGEGYNDLSGASLAGAIVMILEAELDHKRLFDGPEVTRAAALAAKLADLKDAGAAGVISVRPRTKSESAPEGSPPAEISFRANLAHWVGADPDEPPQTGLPVIEVTCAAASLLLGEDVHALKQKIDKSGKPVRRSFKGSESRVVRVASMAREEEVIVPNVVGMIAGSDPALAGEYVVVGAHYDHIGVDQRGRVGCGADDNASGTAALIEVAEALAAAGPRRSVLCVAFAGEEQGLLGSAAFVEAPPVPLAAIVAMLNMDMVGRMDPAGLAVLGTHENPHFEGLLARAKKLKATKLTKLDLASDASLFQRSDHYSFHQKGVPVLFFFEGLPLEENPDYHTWRDTIDEVDCEKVARAARLCFNTAWLIADDEERPPPPQK